MIYLLGKDEVHAVQNVLATCKLDRYIDGEKSISSEFERRFARKITTKHALAVSSGTAALICGLAGMKIGPGDEVIIPSFTYIATALAVLAVGAVPIITEIDKSLTIDPIDIERKITSRTKAIIPVHMHGLPCNMDAIVRLAKAQRLLILEDVAQACGGSYKGRMLGSIGDAGTFSFNHYKIITCGEGGALVTNNMGLYRRATIQHHGGYIFEINPTYPKIQTFAGWNFRISEISSAILQIQLHRLDFILSRLRTEKKVIMMQLRDIHSGLFTLSPIHDERGDCGTSIFLSFNTMAQAHHFVNQATRKNIKVWFPSAKGHDYRDWEPILKKRGAHHPKRDGFNFCNDLPNLSKRMCPRTSSILTRTVGFSTEINRPRIKLDEFIRKLSKILKSLK